MAAHSGLGFPPSASPSASSPTSLLPQTPTSAPLGPSRDDKKPKRGIRQLNEQQLAKKRQNDREAQRAIRERTKNQIESLEQKVKELESGQAYRQLQDLIREKAALKAENAGLKKRLESIYAIVEPTLRECGLPRSRSGNDLEAYGLRSAPLHGRRSVSLDQVKSHISRVRTVRHEVTSDRYCASRGIFC